MRYILVALGFVLVLVGLAFDAVAIDELISGKTTSSPGVLIAIIVLFSGAAVGGGLLVRRGMRSGSGGVPHTAGEREQAILALAEAKRGRLTVAEVAAECRISIDDSKKTLDHFVLLEAAEMQVTEHGVLVYYFPGFLSARDKAAAEDL